MVDKLSTEGVSDGRGGREGDAASTAQAVVWNELHHEIEDLGDGDQHEDDVPVEELLGLADKPLRAKRKTPGKSAIIVHKQLGRKSVLIGTRRSRADGKTRILRSQVRRAAERAVYAKAGATVKLSAKGKAGSLDSEGRNGHRTKNRGQRTEATQ